VSPKSLLRAFVRTLIGLLALLAVLLVVASFYAPQILRWAARTFTPPPAPTPPPPTILAPRGKMPAGVAGLEEWAQYRGEGYQLVGSGFFLRLGDGTVVGVTTAHATPTLGTGGSGTGGGSQTRPYNPEHIAFAVNGLPDHVAEFDTLHGPPGAPRTGFDLSIDYVLLKVDEEIDSTLVLTPDPRGAPQPGERVLLFSGLGDGNGGPRPLAGTVQSAEATGVWVLMDEWFDAGRMSGSPLVSQHTGQVIGMAIAVVPRADRIEIGFHPIGHIVQIAEAAGEFPRIAEYRR
jgi:hypothetical protein